MKVKIPYVPRYPALHEELEAARFAVVVAHRRFGKTVLAINHLLRAAVLCAKPRGFFAYLAPQLKQAKMVSWDYLKHFSSPLPMREVNESELTITIPAKGGRSRIRVLGADNPDSLRGVYLDGVVLDEVAQMKPEVWQEVVRPALTDRQGWALFIGTPKGTNLFSELYTQACDREAKGDKSWLARSFPVSSTSVLPADEIERARQEMSDNAFRQEYLCDFSAASDDVLISIDDISAAMQRNPREHEYAGAPLVFGVDVARFGDDSSVLFPRQGICAHTPLILRKLDNMALADRIAAEIVRQKPAAVFIDAGGGAGVIDRLRQLGHVVTEVPFGSKAIHGTRFLNRRMEMWHGMADWIRGGGALPPSEALKAELSTPTYSFNASGLLQLEPKEKIKERLLRSPDQADALALTFAAPVGAALSSPESMHGKIKNYDPMKWWGRNGA